MDKAEQLAAAIKTFVDVTVAFELNKRAHNAAQVPGEKRTPYVQKLEGSPPVALGELLNLFKQLKWN